jgi:arylsulfatase A-like enzyme
MTRPKNILFLWTDEQRPDTIGAYGNPRIKTPNLDRLAQTGVLFEQAYCAQPVCTPSRGTVVTGVYPHAHGSVRNNIPLTETIPTVAELLQPQGYYCGYVGKWHLGREIHAQRGFDWWSSTEDGYTKDYAEGFSSYYHWLRARGYAPEDPQKDGTPIFSRGSAARLPEEHGKPAFMAQEACRFLDEHGREPFALYVNFLEPHMPFFGPWDGMYAADEMALPATWYTEPDPGMPARARTRREKYAHENPHARENDERAWKALKARYWGLASLVDKYAGVILDRLAALGLAEDTVVVYSTDHGDMMGEHRLVAKGVPYEGAAHVPLIMRLPGVEGVAPARIPAPTSQVDILPTLLDALGHDLPAHLQGKSLLPSLRAGGEDPATAEVVIEWNGEHAARPGVTLDDPEAASQRTLRRGRWKLTVDEAGQHELYDLQTDSQETRNLLYGDRLSHSEEARAAVDDLWLRLRAWRERTRDPLPLERPTRWDGGTGQA